MVNKNNLNKFVEWGFISYTLYFCWSTYAFTITDSKSTKKVSETLQQRFGNFFCRRWSDLFFATFSRVHSLKINEWLALRGALSGELLCRPRSSSELTTSSRSVAIFRTA